ncbi:MAG TPA: hypothetical protein VNR87_13285 [Flavisolibacter sp.]|nr:hypothetical protein [Flavisolibacter sp.]
MKRYQILFFLLFFCASASYSQQVSAPSIQTSFQNFISTESGNVYRGSSLPVFMIKENTKGNRYLFEKWVKGSVTNDQNVRFLDPNVLYNYDKVGRKLLVLLDSSTVVEINSSDVSKFTVSDDERTYTFQRLQNSTDLNYYEPVVENEKGYSLFKLLITKFKAADYQTNGLIQSGNKYDEYVDTEDFYLLTPKKEMIKLVLKEKSIKSVLNGDPKVESFFSAHKKGKIDENLLKQLVDALNAGS